MRFTTGDRIRYSCYALRPLRDGYLEEGNPSRKETKRGWYETKRAELGTVIAVREYGYEIQWDNGSTSQTAGNLVTALDCPLVNPKPVETPKPVKRTRRSAKVTRAQIPGLLEQLTQWKIDNRTTLETLRPDFREWAQSQQSEIVQMVKAQESFSSIQSRVRHMVTTIKRMAAGDIVSVTSDGMGFTLAAKRD